MPRRWLVRVDAAYKIKRYQRWVRSWREALEDLQALIDRRNGVIILSKEEKGDLLQVGVAGDVAFAEFQPHPLPSTPRDQCGPFLFATTDKNIRLHRDNYVSFNVGTTATDIPKRYTVPVPLMLKIAQHYFETETLPKDVRWLEDGH